MTGWTMLAIETLLQECRGVLENQTGCEVTVDVKRGERELDVRVTAQVTLRAVKAVKWPLAALEHADDLDALMTALVNEHLKPLEDQLRRANLAATTSWQAVIPG